MKSVHLFQVPLILLSVCAALGCNGTNSAQESPGGISYPVDSAGPFNTGYATWTFSYKPAPDSAERTVPVHVWYPTEDEHNYRGDPPTQSPVYAGLFADRDTIVDAVPAAPVYESGFPILAFSHGNQGLAGGSYRLMRYFSSHGWLGLAVGHVGNRISDGAEATNRPVTHWHHRPLDISAALDALETLDSSHPLSSADTTSVLLTGHSRGAYTTWAIAGSSYDIPEVERRCDNNHYRDECTPGQIERFRQGFRDARVKAILPTAGNGHSEFFDGVQGRDNLPTPVFFMTATNDDVAGEELFNQISTPNFTWVEITGGCHELFNLGCDHSEDSLKFPIVTTYALAFGRHFILNDTTPETLNILNGITQLSQYVTFKQK